MVIKINVKFVQLLDANEAIGSSSRREGFIYTTNPKDLKFAAESYQLELEKLLSKL